MYDLKKNEVRMSAIATMLMLLLLLGTTLTMFSSTIVAAAADEDSGGDTTSNEVSTSVSESVTTVDEGNSNDGSAETISDGGQDTAPDTTSDAVSEDSSTNEASSEEQATLVDEASTASNDGEVGTTSDGEQSAGVVSDASTAGSSEGALANETSSEGQAAAVVDEPNTASSDGVSDGEQSGVSDQTSNTITATDEEEDPVHIYFPADGGKPISSPLGPKFTVCLGRPLTITVLVKWDSPTEPPKPKQGDSNEWVSWVSVQMVDNSGYGITFTPSSFTLYNPKSPFNPPGSSDSQTVVVNVPAFMSTGTYQVNIYAKVTDQGPAGNPTIPGTNGYFEVEVVSCVKQADLSIDKMGSTTQAHAGDMIIYHYYVTNAGPDAACDVVVSDDVAGTPTYVSGDTDSDGCIDPGETWTFTATYTVHAGDPDPLVNTATVSSDADDPNTSNNVATWSVDLIAMICGYKFYDANANGVWDAGEPSVAGFKIELYDQSGSLLATTFTAADGSYCFDGLDARTYTVQEVLPPSSGWMPTTPISITVTLLSGEIKEGNNFGNRCLEPGHGGRTLGYWANAGNSLITDEDITYLNNLDPLYSTSWGPPFSSPSDIRNYLLKANAKNMWWMLSAQLIATILNVRHGYLDGSTLVCVNPPACTTFMTIDDIINGAIGALGGNVPRATQAYWKDLLDKLNKNELPFVSPEPCPVEYPPEE
jgi:uncharacterized repeat protein (TIGR01451 family)